MKLTLRIPLLLPFQWSELSHEAVCSNERLGKQPLAEHTYAKEESETGFESTARGLHQYPFLPSSLVIKGTFI